MIFVRLKYDQRQLNSVWSKSCIFFVEDFITGKLHNDDLKEIQRVLATQFWKLGVVQKLDLQNLQNIFEYILNYELFDHEMWPTNRYSNL